MDGNGICNSRITRDLVSGERKQECGGSDRMERGKKKGNGNGGEGTPPTLVWAFYGLSLALGGFCCLASGFFLVLLLSSVGN